MTTMAALIDSVHEKLDRGPAIEEPSFFDDTDKAASAAFLQVMMVKHFSLLSLVQLRLGDANSAAKLVDKLGRMWSKSSNTTLEFSPFCDDCVVETLLEMLIYVVNHGTSGEMLLQMSELKLRGMAGAVVEMWVTSLVLPSIDLLLTSSTLPYKRLAQVEFSYVDQARMYLRRGQLEMLNSRKKQANAMFVLAKDTAESYGMSYDEALASLELGTANDEEAYVTYHLIEAAQKFKRLGCEWHLRKCVTKLAKLGVKSTILD